MAVTPKSKIKANQRYMQKNLHRIPLDVKNDVYDDIILPAVQRSNMSVRAFCLAAIMEKIEREND